MQRWSKTPETLREKQIIRKNCPIHYWTGGREEGAPNLVMLHGATMDHRMFNLQVEAFADRYPVLVWDARGHGKSRPQQEDFTLEDCAEDLFAILQAECSNEVVLIGQSMGGYISQFFYRKYPEKVRAMVVIGSTSIAMPYSKTQIIALKASLPLFNYWPHGHMAKTFAHYTALKPDVRKYAFDTINKLDRKTFHRIWKAVTVTVNEKGIQGHEIKVPFLLTHGQSDNTGVIRKQAPEWSASEPNSRYLVIPDAAHNANQDNPEFFNRVLREFLVDIEGR